MPEAKSEALSHLLTIALMHSHSLSSVLVNLVSRFDHRRVRLSYIQSIALMLEPKKSNNEILSIALNFWRTTSTEMSITFV